ncbi:hypothetical protein LCGC14_3045160 [marine sediment metagenome]|uniref:Uncharacterized protein n=1 Tax=marine sediment metagenome TaxID=412755 RepID=A0A0F8ZEE2_9ZZZZ
MVAKILQHDETAITWRNTGGSELFTATSLAAGAGRQGAMHDLTTSARSRRFAWRAFLKPGATRVVKEAIRIYIKTGSGATAGTRPDNDDGTGDIAVSAEDKLENLLQIGTIRIDENAAVEMVANGLVILPHRWVAPVMWNATANSLSATAADFGFDLTPIPLESQ